MIAGRESAARKGKAGAVFVEIDPDKRCIYRVTVSDGNIAVGGRRNVSVFAFWEGNGGHVQQNTVEIGDLRVFGLKVVQKQANALGTV